MSNRVIIFDTTLRDGEQSPGATMNLQEKLRMARQLESLGVDVIEAGFPASSVGDFEAVHAIANAVTDVQVAALARCNKNDIDRAWQALNGARNPRIHVFLATSPIHMEYKLRKTPDQVVEMAVAAVRHAAKYTNNVEFSAEDASRSNPDFLVRVFTEVINAGATTINVPDTVGYAQPDEYGKLIKYVIENTPNSHKAVFSVHCHDDLGLAVANSLSAIQNGARQAEVTLCGIGERAGNASLEEIVMAMKVRPDVYGVDCGIQNEQLYPACRLLSLIIGRPIAANKAIVGSNAFAHESGIHQDGMLKNRETYEIMTAEDVGWTSNRMVLGKLSGRSAFRQRVRELGIPTKSEAEIDDAFARFKDLADRKVQIFDEDIQSLFDAKNIQPQEISFVSLKQESQTGKTPVAEVTYMDHGEQRVGRAEGNGPVDATFQAIESCAKSGAELLLFSINALTKGAEAQGEVTVRLSVGGRVVNGNGSDPDVLAASAKAYLDALNKLAKVEERKNPQFDHEPTP